MPDKLKLAIVEAYKRIHERFELNPTPGNARLYNAIYELVEDVFLRLPL